MSARKCPECGEVHLAGANGAIYCCGPLLRAVQMSEMFKDSKYFVDMPSKYSPDRILADWQLFCSCKKNESSLKHLTNFVENHFDKPGSELEAWCPPDWRSEPAYMAQIKDPKLKKFASALNLLWKQLGRRMKDSVRSNPMMYSLVYVPNPVIMPGGRFTEFYYWDTYWIVRGLLYSGMIQTARGMIDNLLYIVSQYKFVPNGGRIYYWGRSQPPLLVPMVKAYVDMTNDKKYAVQVLPILEMEVDNYLKNHAVQVKGRTMYQYRDKSSGPRPESYREDVASASGFATDAEKEEHYSNLKAACESGMDFSSRWFVNACGNNVGTLADTKTTWIVPVDLNCILFRNCKTIAEFNSWAGKNDRAENYRTTAGSLIKAITAVLWNEERGVWLDYDLKNKVPRDYFVVSNLSPLWARAYPINNADAITESVLAYIEENKLNSFPGGVPHTLSNTGEQWDYPNVWPHMMHILIEGLNNLGTPAAKEMSERWRGLWVRSNLEAFNKTGFMYEKYNCEEFGSGGCGGEYENQTGFGWSNGVIIELLARYGQELSSKDPNDQGCHCLDDVSTGVPIGDDTENCPITSELYLEQKAKNTQTTPMNLECEPSTKEAEDCSVMYCCTVYEEEEEPAKEIESFATSEQQCLCGQDVIVATPMQPCTPVQSQPASKQCTTAATQPPASPCAAAAGCLPTPPPAAAASGRASAPCATGGTAPAAAATGAARASAPCATGGTPPDARAGPPCATGVPAPPCSAAPPPCPPPAAEKSGCVSCPICKDTCMRQQKAPLYGLASDMATQEYCPKGIEIEMEDVNCLNDLTPSQQKEIMDACGCEPSEETMDTAECPDDTKKDEDTCDCDAAPAAPEPVPSAANPMMNKIFPLADSKEDVCFDSKQEKDANAEANCLCCQRRASDKGKPSKECD